MDRRTLLVMLLAFGVNAAALRGDTTPSEAEIVALVNQLASPNSAPRETVPWTKYPEGYDRAAQKRVWEAWRKLWDIGLPAFPHLHKRLDDGRYSVTEDIGPYDKNFSVGQVCRLIMETQLQPYAYYPHGKAEQGTVGLSPEPCYFDGHMSTAKSFERWWKAHKDKSLREVQIEVLEWTISQVNENSGEKLAKEVKRLNDILKDLQDSDKPLPPHFPFAK